MDFSISNSFFKLNVKFNISLANIEAIKPIIPNFGTKKNIKLILSNKSSIFIYNTDTCASSPFKMLSTIISTYINGISRANIFI